MSSSRTEDRADQIQQDRLLAIERIAADVAHELRTPLQSLLINLEVLRRRVQSDARDDALQRTGIVEDEVRRIATMLDAFMIVLRPRGEAQTFDTAAAVARILPVLEVLARSRRLQFTHRVEGILVRAPEEIFLYALARATAAVCDALAPDGTLAITVEPGDTFVDIRLDGDLPVGGTLDMGPIDEVLAGLPVFLTAVNGTISLTPGSPSQPSNLLHLRVARAGRSLTGSSRGA